MTMPPAVLLEKVVALRNGMASEEGEAAMPHSIRFRRPAGRSARTWVTTTLKHTCRSRQTYATVYLLVYCFASIQPCHLMQVEVHAAAGHRAAGAGRPGAAGCT